MFRILLLFFCVLPRIEILAQAVGRDTSLLVSKPKIRPWAEAGGFISDTGDNPYLLRRNQFGVVPVQSQLFTLRTGLLKDYDSSAVEQGGIIKSRRFSYGYGLSLAGNFGKYEQKVYLQEAYVKLRLGAFELWGGRRKEIIGLTDSTLTSGAYIWSGNALPLPKIQLGIPNYVPILWKGLVSVKGAYVHGWFDNSGPIKDFYLHQKWLYGRVGRAEQRWKVYGGFTHQVQWGGYNTLRNKHYPSGLETYIDVVLSLKEDSVNANLAGNRVGDHLGNLDLGFEYRWDKLKLLVYRQSLYEQGTALAHLGNIKDGMNGLSVENLSPVKEGFRWKKINLEFFYTLDMGRSPALIFKGNTGWELEDYFTNGEYPDNWTYKGKTIGNPLITPSNETIIGFAGRPNQRINNNRIRAWQLSSDLQWSERLSTLVQLLYSYNNGRLINNTVRPLTAEQFSAKVQAVYRLSSQLQALLGIAIDRGELYRRNTGATLMVRWTPMR